MAGKSSRVSSPKLTKAQYLRHLEKIGKNAEAVRNCARSLDKLFAFLPDGKQITKETLSRWRQTMPSEGVASAVVNMHISAVNEYLAFQGRWDLQELNQLKKKRTETPE